MIYIVGTDKIKGIVDINSLKLQIKKGSRYAITQDQFYSTDVQTAIRLGLVKTDANKADEPAATEDNIVEDGNTELRNISNKPVTIPVDSNNKNATEVFKFKKKEFKSITLKPKETITVKQSQIKNSEIKTAIATGLLEVITPHNEKVSETTVKLSSKKCEINPLELDTNEEIYSANVIDDENPKPIKSSDIPDGRKNKNIIWNPTKKPILNKKVWEDNIDFVDKEEENRRIESHPKLKNQEIKNNDEIVMVDKKAEEEAVNSHPKLKKTEGNKENEPSS